MIAERPRATDPDEEAMRLHDLYRLLAARLGLGGISAELQPSVPYNLLLTRSWLALIRRSQDEIHGFSVNALGFAGYLLATSRSDLSWLRTNGGEQLLRSVVSDFSGCTDAVS